MTLDPTIFDPLVHDPLLRLHLHALEPAERARHLITLALTSPVLRSYAPAELLSAARGHTLTPPEWEPDASEPVPPTHPQLISRHGHRGILWNGRTYQHVTVA